LSLKTKKLLVLFTPLFLVWIVDQVTKHWIRSSLELHRHEIIEGWLSLNYTQNPGMAMGMDWLSTPSISVVAILATIAICVYVLKTLQKANMAYLLCMGLILGGALKDPVDAAVLLFRGDSPEPAERFAREDPYVQNGLVTSWQVRPWLTVVGDEQASPIYP
jgi:lipoprotein signal peptidase